MERLFIVLILCLISYESTCQDTISKPEIFEMFKQIEKRDQSKLKYPKEREKIFITNFKKIKELIEYQGFLNIDSTFSKRRHGKIVRSGLRMTFTHILQTNPSLILNDKFIDLIRKEIHAQRFCKDYLIGPLSVYVYDNKIKRPIDGVLKDAIRVWGISESEVIHTGQ